MATTCDLNKTRDSQLKEKWKKATVEESDRATGEKK